MVLREVTYLAVILRILFAVIFGGAVGLERGMKNRPAGLRTYMLVCVGSCLIMLTNQYLFQVTGAGDPMRLGAQVVSGIGFLGAGTIIVTKHNQIKGLTTAAGLWASAGVGLALGVAARVFVMLLWNYLITPVYQKVPRDVVVAMLPTVFFPFNLAKGGMNMAATLLLYKPVVTALRKARLAPESRAPKSTVTLNGQPARAKVNVGFLLFSLALLATFVTLALVLWGII